MKLVDDEEQQKFREGEKRKWQSEDEDKMMKMKLNVKIITSELRVWSGER